MEHNAWIQFGSGQELWNEIYSEFGIRAFMAGNTGVQMGGWLQKEIDLLADFRGLKIRIPGLAAEVVNRMGATAVNTPGGEIMPALQAGVVDTAEWVGPWNDLAFGFYKVAKHYYGPGFHEGSTCGELMIDLNAWNQLPKDLQNIVFGASLTTNSRMPSEYFAKNAGSLPVLLNEHNVQPHSFSDDVLRTMYSLSEDLVAETASEGEVNRRAHDNWSQFRHTSTEYQPLSDLGFTRNRALTLGT